MRYPTAPAPLESVDLSTRDGIVRALSQMEAFTSVPLSTLESVAEATTVRAFGAGDVLIRQGDRGTGVFGIVSGEVRVMRAEPGPPKRDVFLGVLGPGELVGEMAVLEGNPRSATVIAREDTVALEVTGEALAKLVLQHPEVARSIMGIISVRETAFRPLARSGKRFWLLAAGLGVLVLWGFVAYFVQLTQGLGAAGYTDKGFWGIYEANLVAFIAVSYGGALVSAILRLTHANWRAPITRLAEAMAVFSLMVGLLFALIHLGRPDHMLWLVINPQVGSPIVWDFVVCMTYLVATFIFLYLPLIPDIAIMRDGALGFTGWRARLYRILALDWRGLPDQHRLLNSGISTIAIMIIPVAVLVHSVLSWAFAFTGRPGWDSTIFAPYFVVAALYAGVAMVILVVAGFRAGYRLDRFIGLKHFQYLGYLLLTLDLLYIYFTFTEMLTEGYVQNEETAPVLEQMLVGAYAPFFWFFIVAGGLVPVLVVAVPRLRTIRGIVAASALVVGAMWLKRLLIIVPAVAHPLISGAWGTFQPTWVAMGITIGAAAAIPLLLMFFFKFFPILSIAEMEEVATEEWHRAFQARTVFGSAPALSPEGGLVS